MRITKTKFNENLKKRFAIAKKCFYPYKYMDDWEKFNEISLPEKFFFIVT